MLRTLILDETGFIVSAELVVVFTLVFCGTVVGSTVVRDSVVHEMHDASEAIGAVSQTYNVTGLQKRRDHHGFHARISGFGFNDTSDDCDCIGIEFDCVAGKDDPSKLNNPEGSNW